MLKRFQKLAAEGGKNYELIGDCLIVEKIPDEEIKTSGGIIIQQDKSRQQLGTFADKRPVWVRVLAVGEGFYSEKGDHPLNVEVGDIALVGQHSTSWFSVFGKLKGYSTETIGLARESDIQLRFKGEEGFNAAFKLLNSGQA